jgi:hypothetical protein
MFSSSLLDQGYCLRASLIDDNPFNTPLKGKTSSFTSVCINNASDSTNRGKDRA